MLVTREEKVEHFHALCHNRVAVVVLAVTARIAYREVVCADFPVGCALLKVSLKPLVYILGSVYAEYRKVNVAIVKCVVFCLPTFGTVIGVTALELCAEKLCRLGVVSADTVAVILESSCVVVALGKHNGHVFRNTFPAEECTVPLLLVLTAVSVVTCSEDEGCIGMLLEITLDE